MLRKIRLTLAVIIFTMTTLLFLDFTGVTHCWLGWIAKCIPAGLIGGECWGCIGIIGINLTLWTCLLFGYLSVRRISRCCFLDSRKTQKESFLLFPGSLMVTLWNVRNFIIAFLAGIGSLVALLDPYGAYGRIASNLFAPLYQWGNNLLAYWAERADSYVFYSVDIVDKKCGYVWG